MKYALVYVNCRSTKPNGDGSNGDYIIGTSVTKTIAAELAKHPEVQIVFISREGGVKKLRNLFPSSTEQPNILPIETYQAKAVTVEEAKLIIPYQDVVLFANIGFCKPCLDHDLRKLINRKTKILFIENEAFNGTTPVNIIGKQYPGLVDESLVRFDPDLDITQIGLGLNNATDGYPQPHIPKRNSDPVVAKYKGSKFGFGYYTDTETCPAISLRFNNYFKLMIDQPYRLNKFILVGENSSHIVCGLGLFLHNQIKSGKYKPDAMACIKYFKDTKTYTKTFYAVRPRKYTIYEVYSPPTTQTNKIVIEVHYYSNLTNSQTKALMNNSTGPVICTGTMSFLEALQMRKIPFYQDLSNNDELIDGYFQGLSSIAQEEDCSRLITIMQLLLVHSGHDCFPTKWDELAVTTDELSKLTEYNKALLQNADRRLSKKIREIIGRISFDDKESTSEKIVKRRTVPDHYRQREAILDLLSILQRNDSLFNTTNRYSFYKNTSSDSDDKKEKDRPKGRHYVI